MELVVVIVLTQIVYWFGWAMGRRERPAAPPWPEAENCTPPNALARRILPYLPTNDR